tara:strand:- start:1008 stop:1184 length:177 start_codon:yes stop_codon:yes gene_type:complete
MTDKGSNNKSYAEILKDQMHNLEVKQLEIERKALELEQEKIEHEQTTLDLVEGWKKNG